MNKSGIFFLILGPSGVGKSTIIKNVLIEFSQIEYYPSYTTRPPRPGETDGFHYSFIDEKHFKQLIANGELVEWDQPHGSYYYGIPNEPALTKLSNGISLIREVAINGLQQITRSVLSKFIFSIFILPDETSNLRERLLRRNELRTDERLNRMEEELNFAEQCSLIVKSVEGNPEIATQKVLSTIKSHINK